MGNIEQALDLGQGVYRQSETNALLDVKTDNTNSLSKVASNVLLSGNLALASSAVTKSNANITYTGNGSTQSITTGIASVDFTVASNGSGFYHDRAAGDCIVKNDAGTVIESGSAVVNTSKVHIKGRSVSGDNNWVVDGLRGGNNYIATDSISAELTLSGAITSFGNSGVTVGTNVEFNRSGSTYTLHQTLYTHIKWGLTNQGKRYLTAYNPVTREVMTMYQGSGIAGHQIPNALGIKLDYWEVKSLDSSRNWQVDISDYRFNLNTTSSGVSDGYNSTFEDNYTLLKGSGDYDANDGSDTFISYGFANSETKIITQYQGTGASGNFVETKDVNGVAKKPRRVITKRTDAVSDWYWTDSARSLGLSSTAELIRLNTSSAGEVASNFDMEYLIDGFKIGNTNIYANASGGQYIAIVEFDTTNSTDDTYFDLPTDDTTLNVTAGKLPYTDGRDTTNGAYNVFTQSYTGSVDFSTCPDGIHYVALDSNNAPKFYEKVAIGSYEKEAADDNRLVFNTDDGKWYTTTGGELVTNGDGSSVAGWTETGNLTITTDGSVFTVNNNTYDGSQIEQQVSLIAGQTYVFKATAINGTGPANLRLGTARGTNDIANFLEGIHEIEFVATTSILFISLRINSSTTNSTAKFDNISVYKKEATLDTPLTTPISFIDDKPYQVVSQTPMDRLVDYPSIPKNVMESSYVDGDLEVSGEVKGKNQCTAWVNFDGTTTPPTIRDSYNVKDVVRTGTGYFEIYFEKPMDNTGYVLGSTARYRCSICTDTISDTKTINRVKIIVVDNYGNTVLVNKDRNDVQIFGGKN